MKSLFALAVFCFNTTVFAAITGPVTIDAADGMTCEKTGKRCTADGGVRMHYGAYTLSCARLVAHFKDGGSLDKNVQNESGMGSASLDRVDAMGGVVIASDDGRLRLTGGYGTYDMNTETAVMTGGNLSFERDDLRVTASESLTFQNTEKIAIARGDGTAISKGRQLNGDILTAFFKDDKKTSPSNANTENDAPSLKKIEAAGHVIVRTDGKKATANRGIYDGQTDTAVLIGDVRLTDVQGQIEAPYGEVNLKTGTSRVLASLPSAYLHLKDKTLGTAKKQVHLLLLGRKKTP